MLDRNKPFNYDLLGGWLVKSPLTKQKLSAFGYASMGEAVRSSEKVCLLADEGTDMSWLTEYLEEINTRCRFKYWFFGHYHDNRKVTPHHICLYEQVVKVCE